jgi:hypothetical protein
MINFDKIHQDDMDWEYTIRQTYGDDVYHISNFNKKDKLIQDIAKRISNVFIGKAFIGSGQEDSKLFGVYANNHAAIDTFWNLLKINKNYIDI